MTIRKKIEDCEPGDELDMGVFLCIDDPTPNQGPNTLNIRVSFYHGGLTNVPEAKYSTRHYIETKGALVRVWNR